MHLKSTHAFPDTSLRIDIRAGWSGDHRPSKPRTKSLVGYHDACFSSRRFVSLMAFSMMTDVCFDWGEYPLISRSKNSKYSSPTPERIAYFDAVYINPLITRTRGVLCITCFILCSFNILDWEPLPNLLFHFLSFSVPLLQAETALYHLRMVAIFFGSRTMLITVLVEDLVCRVIRKTVGGRDTTQDQNCGLRGN